MEKVKTTYVCTDVGVGNGLTLYVDGNSKITVTNGTYEDPKPNALSLPHISTCPGATVKCIKSCYVYGLQKNAPEVYSKYCENERVLHKIFLSNNLMCSTARKFANWVSDNCRGGFRWHVSGDIMNYKHFDWICFVAEYAPDVNFWLYTRTIDYYCLKPLTMYDNIVVNISADGDNYIEARKVASELGVRLCYFSYDGELPDDLISSDVIFPNYSLRGRDLEKPTEHEWWKGLTHQQKSMVCPADFFGQSERHRCGPCGKCLRRPKADILR